MLPYHRQHSGRTDCRDRSIHSFYQQLAFSEFSFWRRRGGTGQYGIDPIAASLRGSGGSCSLTALKRPMKVISRISPVEAIRFQGSQKKNKGLRRGRKQMGVRQLTQANMSMNRKTDDYHHYFHGTFLRPLCSCSQFHRNVSTRYDARKTGAIRTVSDRSFLQQR